MSLMDVLHELVEDKNSLTRIQQMLGISDKGA
jgi:hypothetical protein